MKMLCFFLLFVLSCTDFSSGADLETNSTSQENGGPFRWISSVLGAAAGSNETIRDGNFSESLYAIILQAKNATSDIPSIVFDTNKKQPVRIVTDLECSLNKHWCVFINLYLGQKGHPEKKSEWIGNTTKLCTNQRRVNIDFTGQYEVPEYEHFISATISHSCNNINRDLLEFSGDILGTNRLFLGDLLNRSDIKPTPVPGKMEESPWYEIPVFN